MGGATPFQLDVTEAANPGGDNVIAVRVSQETEASKMDHMSMYADFLLAGIFRRTRFSQFPSSTCNANNRTRNSIPSIRAPIW